MSSVVANAGAMAFVEQAKQQPELVAAIDSSWEHDSFLRAVIPAAVVKGVQDKGELGISARTMEQLQARKRDFERLLDASVREEDAAKPQTLLRLVEKLAAEMGTLSEASEWFALRAAAAEAIRPAVAADRRSAQLPFIPLRVRPSPLHGDSNQVKELVLMTLSSMVRACPVDRPEIVHEPLQDLADMVGEYHPQELFEDWSPPRAPPSIALPLEAHEGGVALQEGVIAHATRGGGTASLALTAAGTLKGGWKSGSLSFGSFDAKSPVAQGDAVYTVRLASQTTLASVTVEWEMAPETVNVQVYTGPFSEFLAAEAKAMAAAAAEAESGNAVDVDKARVCGDERRWMTIVQDAPVPAPVKPGSFIMTLPLGNLRGCAVRIIHRRGHKLNSETQYAVKSLVLARPNGSALHTPALAVITDIQAWLLRAAVAAAAAKSSDAEIRSSVEDTAFKASASLAKASAALPAALRHIQGLLGLGEDGAKGDIHSLARSTWLSPVPPMTSEADEELLTEMLRAKKAARARFDSLSHRAVAGAQDDPSDGSITDFRFDTSLCDTDSSSLSLREGGRVVATSTGSNRVCLVNKPFRSGKVVITFKNEEDHEGGECSCYGLAIRPVTSTSYSNDNTYFYRCYNGQLYGEGSDSSNKRRVHPNDVIEITLDFDSRTISYSINGESQGVCFRNIRLGVDYYPAVQFYSSSCAARVVSIKRVLTPAEKREMEARRALKAAEEGAGAHELTPEEELAALLGGQIDAAEDSAVPLPPGAPPVPPDPLPAAHDKEAIAGRFPDGVLDALMAMSGASWFVAAAAMDQAGGNPDAAADALLEGRIDVSVVEAEHKAVVGAFERAMTEYNLDLKDYESSKEAYEKHMRERVERIKRAASTASGSDGAGRPRMRDALAILCAVDGLVSIFSPSQSTSLSAVKDSSKPSLVASAPQPVIVQVREAKDAMDLEEPFCILAKGETFSLLASLIRSVMPLVRGQKVVDPTPSDDASEEARVAGAAMQICLRGLHLIRANLERLEQAHVDPAEADIVMGGDKPTLASIRSILSDFMAPNGDGSGSTHVAASGVGGSSDWVSGGYPVALQSAAVEVTQAGLTLLYGSADERAELVAELVRRHLEGRLAPVQADLLNRCIERFTTPAGAVSLLPPSRAQIIMRIRAQRERDGLTLPDAADEEVAVLNACLEESKRLNETGQTEHLLRALFTLVSEASKNGLLKATASLLSGDAGSKSEVAPDPTESRLLANGAKLLGQFQRLLVSLVAEEIEEVDAEAASLAGQAAAKVMRSRGTFAMGISTAKEPVSRAEGRAVDSLLVGPEWVPGSALVAAPACQVLVSYTTLLCNAAKQFLAAALPATEALAVEGDVATRAGMRRRHAMAIAMTASVRKSIVGRLVAPFAISIAQLHDQPWLASAVVPFFVQLSGDIDKMCSRLVPASASATRALADAHGIKFEAPALGSDWGSGPFPGIAQAVPSPDADKGSAADGAAASASVAVAASAASVDEEESKGDSSDAEEEEEAEDDSKEAETGWRPPQGQLLFKGFVSAGDVRPDVWMRLRIERDEAAEAEAVKRAAAIKEAKKSKGKSALPSDRLNGAIYRVHGHGVMQTGPRRFVARGSATADGRIALCLGFLPLPTDDVVGEAPPPPVLLVTTHSGTSSMLKLSGVAMDDALTGIVSRLIGTVEDPSSDIHVVPFPSKSLVTSLASSPLGFLLQRCDDSGNLAVATDDAMAADAGKEEAELLSKLHGSKGGAAGRPSKSPNEEHELAAKEEARKQSESIKQALGPSGRSPRHPLLAVQRVLVAGTAHLAASLVQGPRMSFEEVALEPLFASPAFAGGLPLALVATTASVEMTKKSTAKAAAAGGGDDSDDDQGGEAGCLDGPDPFEVSSRHPLAQSMRGDPLGFGFHWHMASAEASNGRLLQGEALKAAVEEEASLPDSVIEEDSWLVKLCDCDGKDKTQAGNQLLFWLDAVAPETGPNAKKAKFPRVVLPSLLACVKHSGGSTLATLRDSVVPAIQTAFASGKTAVAVAREVACPLDLKDVWEEVKQLRKFLRDEKDNYKQRETKKSAETSEGGSTDGGDEDDEALRAEAAKAQALGGTRMLERRLNPKEPATMKDLSVSIRNLSLFFLGMRPSRPSDVPSSGSKEDVEAAALASSGAPRRAVPPPPPPGSSGDEPSALLSPPRPMLRRSSSSGAGMAGLSQLQARWSAALPQKSLTPLLQRWSSTGAAPEGEEEAGDDGSALARIGGVGMVARLARMRAAKARVASERAEEAEEDGDDLADLSALGVIQRSPARAAAFNLVQVFRTAFATPPALLRRLLFWRLQRSRSRIFGLSALAALLQNTSLPGPQADVLIHVRSGLSSSTEMQETADRLRRQRELESAQRQESILSEMRSGAGPLNELITTTDADDERHSVDEDSYDDDSDDSYYRTRRVVRDRRALRRRVVTTLREGGSLADVADLLVSSQSSSSSSKRSGALDEAQDGLRGTWRRRHHYLAALEGVPSAILNDVQLAHMTLHTRAGDLLGEAAAIGDTTRALRACWAWATDMEPRDHEFLLRVGLLPALRRASQGRGDLALASLKSGGEITEESKLEDDADDLAAGAPRMLRFVSSVADPDSASMAARAAARAASLAGEAPPSPALSSSDPTSPPPLARLGSAGAFSGEARAAPEGAHDGEWRPWELGTTRAALLRGDLSKRALIAHMQAAPDSWLVRGTASFRSVEDAAGHDGAVERWLASRGLSGDPAFAATSIPTSELLTAYAEFGPQSCRVTDPYFGLDSSLATDSLKRSDAAHKSKASSSSGTASMTPADTGMEDSLGLSGPGCAGLARTRVDRSFRPPRKSESLSPVVSHAAHTRKSRAEKGDRPALVPAPVAGNEATYIDKPESFKLAALPPTWTQASHRAHIHLVRGCHATGTAASKGRLVLRFTQPCRLYVLIPNGRSNLPDWVGSDFSRARQLSVRATRGNGSVRVYECYSSNTVYVPEADATETKGYVELTIRSNETREGSDSADGNDEVPFLYFVEDFPRQSLVDLPSLASTASAELASTTTLRRVHPPRAPEGMLQRATATLFQLLCATGVAGSAGLRLGARSDSDAKPASSETEAARAGIAPGVGRVPLSQTWRYSVQLQQVAFSLQREVLDLSAAAMASAQDSEAGLDVLEAERAAITQLRFLSAVADTTSAQLYLSSPPFMATLLSCLRCGSPRIRRTVLELFNSLAGVLPLKPIEAVMRRVFAPEDIDRWSDIGSDGAGETSAFVGMLLELSSLPTLAAIGVPPPRDMAQPTGENAADGALHAAISTGSVGSRSVSAEVARSPTGDALWAVPGFGSGETRQAIASGAVSLLRRLVSGGGDFSAPTSAVLCSSLLSVDALTPESDRFPASQMVATKLYGSLMVTGGHVETVHRGGRVVVGRDLLRARVVELPVGKQDVRVVYSDDITASPQPCDPRQIAPIDKEETPVRHLTKYSEALVLNLDRMLSRLLEISSPAWGEPPLWVSRLCSCTVSTLASLLQSPKVVRSALGRPTLATSLFELALKSVSRRTDPSEQTVNGVEGFLTPFGLRNRYNVVEARLAESEMASAAIRAADSSKASLLRAVASPLTALPSAAGPAKVDEASLQLTPARASELALKLGLPVSVVQQSWLLVVGALRSAAGAPEEAEGGPPVNYGVTPSEDLIAKIGAQIQAEWPQPFPRGIYEGDWQLPLEEAAAVYAESSGPPGSGDAAREVAKKLAGSVDLSSLLPTTSAIPRVACAAKVRVELMMDSVSTSTAGAVGASGSAPPSLEVTEASAKIRARVIYMPRRLGWDMTSADAGSAWVAECVGAPVQPGTDGVLGATLLRVVRWQCAGDLQWPPAWTKDDAETSWTGVTRKSTSKDREEGKDDDEDDDEEEDAPAVQPPVVEGEHFVLRFADAAGTAASLTHSRWSRRSRAGADEAGASKGKAGVTVMVQTTPVTLPPPPSDESLVKAVTATPSKSSSSEDEGEAMLTDSEGVGPSPASEALARLGLAGVWNTGAPMYSLKPLVLGASSGGSSALPEGFTAEEYEWATSGWGGCRRATWRIERHSSNLISVGFVKPTSTRSDTNFIGCDDDSYGFMIDGRSAFRSDFSTVMPVSSYLPEGTEVTMTHYPDGRFTVKTSASEEEVTLPFSCSEPLLAGVSIASPACKVRLIRTVPPYSFDKSAEWTDSSPSRSGDVSAMPMSRNITISGEQVVSGREDCYIYGAWAIANVVEPVPEVISDLPTTKVSEDLKPFLPMVTAGASPAWVSKALAGSGFGTKEVDKFFKAALPVLTNPKSIPEPVPAAADGESPPTRPRLATPLVIRPATDAAASSAASCTVRGVEYPSRAVITLSPPPLPPISSAAAEDEESIKGSKTRAATAKALRETRTEVAAGHDFGPGARASRTLRLNQRFGLFQAQVSVSDAGLVPSSGDKKGGYQTLVRPVVFEAIADGAVVWRSRLISEPRQSDSCTIPVFATSALRLCVRAASVNEILNHNAEVDAALAAAAANLASATPGSTAHAVWTGITPPTSTDGVRVEDAVAVWIAPRVSGSGAATLPPGSALAVLGSEDLKGESAPSIAAEMEAKGKSSKGSDGSSDGEASDSRHRRLVGRHHPFCNYISALRALPLVTYSPLDAARSFVAAESSLSAPLGVTRSASLDEDMDEDAAADAPLPKASEASLRVLVLDPETGLYLPRHVQASRLAIVESIYGVPLTSARRMRADASWSSFGMAVFAARDCLRFILEGAASAAEAWSRAREKERRSVTGVDSGNTLASQDSNPYVLGAALSAAPALLSTVSSIGKADEVAMAPSSCLSLLGGASNILRLLRLAAANDEGFRQAAAPDSAGGSDGWDEEMDQSAVSSAGGLVRLGHDGSPEGTLRSLRQSLHSLLATERAEAAELETAKPELISALISETTDMFAQCAVLPPAYIVESLHPHSVGGIFTGSVGEASASGLVIQFDPRTGFTEGCKLELFMDSSFTEATRVLSLTGTVKSSDASSAAIPEADALASMIDTFENFDVVDTAEEDKDEGDSSGPSRRGRRRRSLRRKTSASASSSDATPEPDYGTSVHVPEKYSKMAVLMTPGKSKGVSGKAAYKVRMTLPVNRVYFRFTTPASSDSSKPMLAPVCKLSEGPLTGPFRLGGSAWPLSRCLGSGRASPTSKGPPWPLPGGS
jgi:hypothetical protein